MGGKGRQPILGFMSPDPVLALVGPVGLAASRGTALVVDLEADGAGKDRRTLRDLVVDGPTRGELSPARPGIALIAGGGVDHDSAIELIGELSKTWPAVVVRVPTPAWPYPTVPAFPLYPGHLMPSPPISHCVWQPVGTGATPPGPGVLLPRLRPGTLRRLLSGHLPRRSRWVAAWSAVWEMPWA
jgi:hypothetical protein